MRLRSPSSIIEKRDEVEKNMAEKSKKEKAKQKQAEETGMDVDELLESEENGGAAGGSSFDAAPEPLVNIDIDADDDYTEFTPE